MLDATLPLTTSEYIEWGNPNDKAAFDYIRRLLALRQRYGAGLPGDADRGVAQRQPDAGLGGPSVAPASARRRPTATRWLLKSNLGAGHGGASGRYDALRETAFTNAFILWQMGLA